MKLNWYFQRNAGRVQNINLRAQKNSVCLSRTSTFSSLASNLILSSLAPQARTQANRPMTKFFIVILKQVNFWCMERVKMDLDKNFQRSKLTFSKSCLLVTFNCKMVATTKNSVAKKKPEGEDTSWHITRREEKENVKGKNTDKLHEGLMRRTARFAAVHCKFMHSSFWTTRVEKRNTGDAATCTID